MSPVRVGKRVPAEITEDFKTSPEHVRVSVAAAITLGLRPGRMFRNATCDCVNLLENYPAGCYANCTYCGLARERPGVAQDNTFIRVGWPVFPTDLVARAVATHADRVGRVCVAMVQDRRAYADLLEITRRIRAASDVPISALVTATLLDEERLRRIRDAGADIVGIGLDAASEAVFVRTRGRGARGPHSWTQHWAIARAARRIFGPFKVNCHVIVGLGESDRDLIELFYQLKREQIAAYLFSFNPEPGTAMADTPRAPLIRWRRIQLTKWLIERHDLPPEAIEFDATGSLARVRAPRALIEACLAEGTAFMTNGCPDRTGQLACNRPFGSYRPGEAFRDYPFVPTEEDRAVIRAETRYEDLLG
jgi:biotin synthase-related radical SAM superfamily protein